MKQNAKRALSLLLALMMLCSLCVNALAVNEVKVNATLDKNEITTSSEPQTVKVTIAPETALTVCNYGMTSFQLPEGWTIAAIENDDPNAILAASDVVLDTGNISWMTDDMENVTVSKLAIYTITVPADVEPGSYTLTANKIVAGKDYAAVWVLQDVSPSVTLTVKDNTPAADGYTVAVSGNTTIQTDGEAEVKLNITHSDANETSYAAYSMKVSYNKDVLTYKSFSDADATVTDDGNGNLTIYRYGKDLTLGQNLTLSFAGKAGGTGEVKVTEAKIDKSENALKDAPAATVTGSATITVGQTYTVNRDANVVDGNPKAEAGKDYTFKLTNGLDGTYMDVKYKIGDGEFKDLMLVDGKYTIPADEITGDITITAVGKKFDVTVDTTASGAGNVTLTDGSKATYGTNYTFTLTPEANYAYTVTVTAGGKTVTPALDADGKIYTINGTDITGNVVITVTKEANKAQINFAGSGSADVVNGSASQIVEPGQEFKFSIHKEDGYAYTVTAAKANDTTVTVTDNGDGTYTIAGADIAAGDVITVTVEKKLIETKYTIEVNEFVKLDANAEGKAQSVFLITAKLNGDAKLADGKVLAYGNNAMFQNAERYDGAYAYLVISDKSLAEVKAEAEKTGQITEVDGIAQTFNVNGDVNGTGLVDINDAQLVYNIYNAKYDSFETTTMKMFLAADVNKDREVSALDAAAVVGLIK